MNYKDLLQKQLAKFSSKGYDRTFTPIYRYQETFPFTRINLPNEKIKNDKINPETTIWCSNDYLNMSHNPEVINRMIEVIKELINFWESGETGSLKPEATRLLVALLSYTNYQLQTRIQSQNTGLFTEKLHTRMNEVSSMCLLCDFALMLMMPPWQMAGRVYL